jgi:anti-sigma regulatory factor (Ser/Thr protein kinase)
VKPGLTRAQTSVSAAITISPLNHISGDVGGLLGNFLFQLLGMFYPRRICARANVAITELITNVMEHASSRDGEISLSLTVNPQELIINVSNSATVEEYESIRTRFEEITAARDPKQLLATTVYERHVDRRKGGLGLMRLAAESKFQLSAQYVQGLLLIRAHLSMEGLV